jgi:hypothetical protein
VFFVVIGCQIEQYNNISIKQSLTKDKQFFLQKKTRHYQTSSTYLLGFLENKESKITLQNKKGLYIYILLSKGKYSKKKES